MGRPQKIKLLDTEHQTEISVMAKWPKTSKKKSQKCKYSQNPKKLKCRPQKYKFFGTEHRTEIPQMAKLLKILKIRMAKSPKKKKKNLKKKKKKKKNPNLT